MIETKNHNTYKRNICRRYILSQLHLTQATWIDDLKNQGFKDNMLREEMNFLVERGKVTYRQSLSDLRKKSYYLYNYDQ